MSASMPWLTLIVLSPLAGALLLAFVPSEHKEAHRMVGGFFALLSLLFFLPVAAGFDPSQAGMQFTSAAENVAWIPALGARYHLGIDGLSLWLVGLTTVLGVVAAMAGVTSIQTASRTYYAGLLTLLTAVLGALCSLDLLLFALFWELMLLPLALLVGTWGDRQRVAAATKLFVVTLVCSMPMMAAIFYLWVKGGSTSFGVADIAATAQGLPVGVQQALFLAFCLAFFVKLPIPPLHTWLPEAHAQTSTAGSFVLGAIVFQAGTYGLIRFAIPLFPDAVYWAAPAIGILSAIAIVYGALIAVTQRDMKKMIAFSSVSHLGFITLGLFAINQVGMTGALVQSLAHSVTAGALFLLAGVLIDRYESRSVDDYGGLAAKMPVFAVLFVFLIMAYAGVPGLVGFVGEFLVLAGAAGSWAFSLTPGNTHFGSLPTGPDTTALVIAFVAGLRVVVGAIYLLGLTKRLMLGSVTGSRFSKTTDVTWAEAAPLLPLVFLSLWVGLQPGFFTSRMDASVKGLLSGLVEHSTLAKETAANMAAQQETVANWNRDGRSPEAWPLQRKQAAANGDAPAEGHAAQPGAANQGGHP